MHTANATPDLAESIRQAEAAANASRWDVAEALWQDIRRIDPRHPKAAFSLGIHALQRRDFTTASTLITQACEASPGDPFLWLTLSRAKLGLGDEAGEADAIARALSVDPYFVPAVLAKAQRLRRVGGNAASAAFYFRTAVRIAGPEDQWPGVLRRQLAEARDIALAQSRDAHVTLEAAIAPLISSLSRDQAERWREATSIMAGVTEPYRQQANQLYVPRLPAIPFYDRGLFSWAEEIESRTALIREELGGALAQEQDFAPYIALEPGQPVDQWRELNHSAKWSHYGLWRNGQPNEVHLARCPETRRALEAVDMAAIDGLCPNAMFSALAPHTEIPPHTGETNARLVVHLPLIVPESCSYRVGFQHRSWKEGELLVFDDTIEHTARNDSDQLRVVLIFDVWNPLLTLEEREVVRTLATTMRKAASAR